MLSSLRVGATLVSLVATTAFAQPAPPAVSRLSYEAPLEVGCPDELGFVDLVRARTEGALFDPEAASELAVAVDADSPPLLRGRIEWRGPDGRTLGRREIEGADCASLAEALAVAASIALEAMQELGEPAPSPAVVVRVVERDPERPPALTPDEPLRGPSVGATLHAAVGAGYGPGPLPHASFELGGAITYDALAVPLALRYSDSFAYGGLEGGYALRTRLLRGIVGACVVPAPLEICGIGSLGLLEGEAQGVADPELAQALFGSAGATFGATLMFDARVGMRARAELSLILNRTTFVVDTTPLWTGLPVLVELDVSVLSRW